MKFMSNINFLAIITITALLSGCGFHTPHTNNALNATIISAKNNAFAAELEKRFNPVAIKSLVIEIGEEVQKKQAASYDIRGEISSYTLSVSVAIKVFDADKNLLLVDKLTDRSHLQRELAIQADRLQIAEYYRQLRHSLIQRLLRKLNHLH